MSDYGNEYDDNCSCGPYFCKFLRDFFKSKERMELQFVTVVILVKLRKPFAEVVNLNDQTSMWCTPETNVARFSNHKLRKG